ncbi:MAG: CmcI family methyltransferase [Verrucomicrobiota bacterium]
MQFQINTDEESLTITDGESSHSLPLYSNEAFEKISDLWVKVGWSLKYPYTFSWLGRPVIQLPEDMIRIQELIYSIKPDIIIETGVAHGGSLIYYASLFEAMGKGHVIGVDIEIRPHNRKAIEEHRMFSRISLIEGSSTAPEIVSSVKQQIPKDATVLVILDSDHSRDHVLEELESYHGFVSPGSYIVATDGVMNLVADAPRGKPEWSHDNPIEAVKTFCESHSEFILEQPSWPFSESDLKTNVTHWPSAYLRRV